MVAFAPTTIFSPAQSAASGTVDPGLVGLERNNGAAAGMH